MSSDNGIQLSTDEAYENFSIPEDVGIMLSSSESNGDVIRSRRLVNRIAYIGLLISILAPFWHAYLNFEVIGLGPPFNLVAWSVFGVGFGCTFTALMYPIFFVIASLIRLLDVIPALGTSLWVLGSIRFTVAVLNVETPVPVINMLWLYCLTVVNGMVVQSSLAREDANILRMIPEVVIRYLPIWKGIDFEYLFERGKCRLCDAGAKLRCDYTVFVLHPLSVSEGALRAYQRIRNKSLLYLRGERLSEFASDFAIWRREAERVFNLGWRRALFCLVGYVIETATLAISLRFLGDLKWFEGVAATSSHLLWPFALVLLLSRCSDYVPMLLDRQDAFTSLPEVSSQMLSLLSSHMDCSGRRSGYLANGRPPAPRGFPRYDETGVGELPTIGIVAEPNRGNSEANLLRNTLTGHTLTLRRVGPGRVQVRILKGDDRRMQLQEERVLLTEYDMVI